MQEETDQMESGCGMCETVHPKLLARSLTIAVALLSMICALLFIYSLRCIYENEKCREELAEGMLDSLWVIALSCDTALDDTESLFNRNVAFGNIRRNMIWLFESYNISSNHARALSRPTFRGQQKFWSYEITETDHREEVVSFYQNLERKFEDTTELSTEEIQSIMNLRGEADAVLSDLVSNWNAESQLHDELQMKQNVTQPYLLSETLHSFWHNLNVPSTVEPPA